MSGKGRAPTLRAHCQAASGALAHTPRAVPLLSGPENWRISSDAAPAAAAAPPPVSPFMLSVPSSSGPSHTPEQVAGLVALLEQERGQPAGGHSGVLMNFSLARVDTLAAAALAGESFLPPIILSSAYV